ncbi:glycine zipper 2TM domain-containing protein [Sphingomonas crusticola]|uniref:glycine zipper 2TM domain-containing protein n=1 Tax=Sphingomonas crusticola TaxID=1697973 RepID=UPI001F074834|nr:glycine zipper 2TM domain-containing protein [Sphingomonas crusticola]
MKMNILASAAVLAMLGAMPLTAQPSGGWNSASSGNWDRDAFWRGAPADPRQRIQFLQQRIDRGVADGSLSRREARNAQLELNNIRRDALRRGWNSSRSVAIQQRLDTLSQRLRWQRHNGDSAYGRNGAGYASGGAGYYAGNDPRFRTNYDASRYYRDGPNYSERRLSSQDEIYRGSDGRYYCKRNDGTTGLIVGAAGGGILGNVIDGGHNRTAGTLIGGALGALLGKSIEQNNDVRCR